MANLSLLSAMYNIVKTTLWNPARLGKKPLEMQRERKCPRPCDPHGAHLRGLVMDSAGMDKGHAVSGSLWAVPGGVQHFLWL